MIKGTLTRNVRRVTKLTLCKVNAMKINTETLLDVSKEAVLDINIEKT
jgi:hypothetical protein